MKFNFKILMLLFSLISSAQEEQINLILGYPEEQELYFHEYNPRLIIKADYSSLSEVKNEYPEELVQSILSATSQEWVDFNTLGGSKKSNKKRETHFEEVKKMNKEKNFFELCHKLTIQHENYPVSIIKFYFHSEISKPISGAVIMKKVGNRWYRESSFTFSDLSLIVMRLKSEVLRSIVLGNSDKKETNLLVQRTTDNGILTLDKLEQEFDSWYYPKEDKNKIELFVDPKTW